VLGPRVVEVEPGAVVPLGAQRASRHHPLGALVIHVLLLEACIAHQLFLAQRARPLGCPQAPVAHRRRERGAHERRVVGRRPALPPTRVALVDAALVEVGDAVRQHRRVAGQARRLVRRVEGPGGARDRARHRVPARRHHDTQLVRIGLHPRQPPRLAQPEAPHRAGADLQRKSQMISNSNNLQKCRSIYVVQK